MRKRTANATINHNKSREGYRARERKSNNDDATIYHNNLREGQRVRESTDATINHY